MSESMQTTRLAPHAVQRRHLQVVHGAAPHAVPSAPARPAPFWAARLSRREIEVLHCIAAGLSTAEIAETLFISTATVKSHIARLIAKVEVRDRLQLIIAAYRSGFVRVE